MVDEMQKKKEPIRVLHILTGLTNGGAETFIMNMYRQIDREKILFDFLLRSDDNVYKDELERMGSKVYVTSSFPRHFIRNAIETSSFFKNHSYDIVHVHANALLYMFALKCAKKNGVKCRIMHSHNTAMLQMKLLPLHNFNKKRIHNLATDYFACSDDAGKWMFSGEYTVVNNAINISDFEFNGEKRKKLREQFGIKQNDLVIGHVGRFQEQKNHTFLVDIMSEVVKEQPNSKLVLIGDGDLRASIEEKVKNMGLLNNILFLGARNDVRNLMNIFDLFVLPSIYEGMPLVLIEALGNGLKILSSEAVPNFNIFNEAITTLNLSAGADYWAKEILETNVERLDMKKNIKIAGFDIVEEAKKLQEFYIDKVK